MVGYHIRGDIPWYPSVSPPMEKPESRLQLAFHGHPVEPHLLHQALDPLSESSFVPGKSSFSIPLGAWLWLLEMGHHAAFVLAPP